jgi:hypothetical protein
MGNMETLALLKPDLLRVGKDREVTQVCWGNGYTACSLRFSEMNETASTHL